MVGFRMSAPATPLAASNAFIGLRRYVEPDSPAARQAAAWRTARPADAAEMDEIAGAPQAQWYGNWNRDVAADVRKRVSAAAAVGRWTLLVAYNIPQRDCSGHSAGGAAAGDAYRAWIPEFARGIGPNPAAVVLEPDALAGLDCLTTADRATRLSLLRDPSPCCVPSPAWRSTSTPATPAGTPRPRWPSGCGRRMSRRPRGSA